LNLSLAAFVGTIAFATVAAAQGADGVSGRWMTENQKGVIEIAPCGGSICGKIDWMKPPPGADLTVIPRDKHNHDPARRQQPMCGLQILYGFHHDAADPKKWTEGNIYDPESGDVYHGNITVQDAGHLRLRGYIGIPLLGESQIWTRVGDDHAHCHAG
jgi:uncharacterized protein (DUF2147 family)